MANEEPKPFSSELKALRDEFKEVAERTKQAIAKLDSAIWKQEILELHQANDKVVSEFAPPGDIEAVRARDITLLINKSKDMGDGRKSSVGAAVDVANRLHLVLGKDRDVTLSASLWEKGAPKGLRLGDYDRIDKALEKTEANDKDIVPALRDIMVANTPDKVTDRNKHYVIISDGNATDNLEHAMQMIEATLLYNKHVTFDFVTVGEAQGNLSQLAAKVSDSTVAARVGFHTAKTQDDVWGTVTGVLKDRISASPWVKPEEPKAEAAPEEKKEQKAASPKAAAKP